MSSLLFQGHFATGLEESEAQSTVEPIRTDNSEAEAEAAPEFNMAESDDSGQLIGLSPRVVGSATEYPEKSTPDIPLYSQNHNEIIDNQVASSGTAAAREAAGQRGHGTMQYAEGIEPLNPAQVYGNDYFKVPDPGIQSQAGLYMTPGDNGNNWPSAVAQAAAVKASRDAFRSTQYANFFGDK